MVASSQTSQTTQTSAGETQPAAPHAPATPDATVSPGLARYTRFMIVVVTVLGILLLVGLAVVVGTIIKRMSGGPLKAVSPDLVSSADVKATPADVRRLAGRAVELDLAAGTHIASVDVTEGLIIIQIQADKTQKITDIVSFDARTGEKRAHLRLP